MSKKLVIPRSSLPDINAITGKYEVRFRLTTEDRNRFSYWSPIFSVDPGFTYQSGNIDIAKTSNHVNIIWDAVKILKDSEQVATAEIYDIWLRWGKTYDGDWFYKERIEGTSISVVIPDSYFWNGVEQMEKPNKITVEIYLRGRPITRDYTLLRVYNPPVETV